jgi:hypothetical protein
LAGIGQLGFGSFRFSMNEYRSNPFNPFPKSVDSIRDKAFLRPSGG